MEKKASAKKVDREVPPPQFRPQRIAEQLALVRLSFTCTLQC
jgi:hypothetical protein